MNWNELTRQVIGLGAPVLGAALGGPLGEAAGKILADVLGAPSPTPDAVQTTLPQADAAQVAQAEAQWIGLMQAESETARAALVQTHETMRAELHADDALQRLWRPLYALELTVECALLWAVLVRGLWMGNVAPLNALIAGSGLFVAYWGFRFGVLGVYVSGRTREKVCAMAGADPGSLAGRIGAAVKSLRKP